MKNIESQIISSENKSEDKQVDYFQQLIFLQRKKTTELKEQLIKTPDSIYLIISNSLEELAANPDQYRGLEWNFLGKVLNKLLQAEKKAGSLLIKRFLTDENQERKVFFLTNILFSISTYLENRQYDNFVPNKLIDKFNKPELLKIVEELKNDENQEFLIKKTASYIFNWYTAYKWNAGIPSVLSITNYGKVKISKDYFSDGNFKLYKSDDNNSTEGINFFDPLLIQKKEKNKYDIYNFSLLQLEPIRKGIEEKFQIKLSDLNLLEQFHFLNFLKSKKEREIITTNDFCKKFGFQGLRTFLSIEHGGKEMGDKILELGEMLPEKEAGEIFKGYSKLINTALLLQQTLEKAIKKENDSSFNQLPFQIHDALLLRAKDILIGAYMIAKEDGKEKLNTEDVIKALEGITLTLDILADIENKKKYNFSPQIANDENLFKYKISDKTGHDYNLKIFIRPTPEKSAQARVNIELSFDTKHPNIELQKVFYNEIIFNKENKKTSGSVLRIGIDREEYGGIGQLSLDIGRSERISKEFSRTGDTLGNLLVKASVEGHHTVSPFDKKFGEQEIFSKIAFILRDYLKNQKN